MFLLQSLHDRNHLHLRAFIVEVPQPRQITTPSPATHGQSPTRSFIQHDGHKRQCVRPTRVEMDSGLSTEKELRAAVCKRFVEENDRRFKAGNGGGSRRGTLAPAHGVSCHCYTGVA